MHWARKGPTGVAKTLERKGRKGGRKGTKRQSERSLCAGGSYRSFQRGRPAARAFADRTGGNPLFLFPSLFPYFHFPFSFPAAIPHRVSRRRREPPGRGQGKPQVKFDRFAAGFFFLSPNAGLHPPPLPRFSLAAVMCYCVSLSLVLSMIIRRAAFPNAITFKRTL